MRDLAHNVDLDASFFNLDEIQIQLDLQNNALVYLNKPLDASHLNQLRKIVEYKIKTRNINDIIFKLPESKSRKRISSKSIILFRNIIDFIENFFEYDYQEKLKKFMKSNFKKGQKRVQLTLFNDTVSEEIQTLQYRGNETQIINFIRPNFTDGDVVLDLMAGSQNLGLALKKSSKIISNDTQYYSYVLGKAYIENNQFLELSVIPKDLIHSHPSFNLFQKYYSDVYFTRTQCKEIDNIRATLEVIKMLNKNLFFCYLTCLLQCLDTVVRTTGYFDGSLDKTTLKVKSRESKAIYEEFSKKIRKFKSTKSKFKNRCYNLSAEELLTNITSVDVIYTDPPYNHQQYSRYYHILETGARYDKNINLSTKGRYRRDEFKSDFCYEDRAEESFRLILNLSYKKAKKKILISYTNKGLLDQLRLLEICQEFDSDVKLIEKEIKNTRQKTSKSKKIESELLFILTVKDHDWMADFIPNQKKTLVITSCSKKKDQSRGRMKSAARYCGQLFNLTHKFTSNNDYELLIISAKYGLLKPDDLIENYDLRLQNQKEALQLKPKVIPQLKKILKEEDYERIIIIMGKLYRKVIEDLVDERFVFLESKNGIFDYMKKMSQLTKYF